jgi:phage shock protein A
MALMERVTTLLRANLNDLIDRAENPEKMMKQLLLDMENQLLQVKTQVAIAIADQHLLERKASEHESSGAGWKEKAQLALAKGREDMAREALGRVLTHKQMAMNFAQQLEDQKAETESLRSAYFKLQQKLVETRAQCEWLLAEHKRARTVTRSQQARDAVQTEKNTATLGRWKARVQAQQAANQAQEQLAAGDSLEERFAALERSQQIELLLEELKRKELSAESRS